MNCCPRALRAAGLRLGRPTQNPLSTTASRASPARPTPLSSLPRATGLLPCASFHSSAPTQRQPPPRPSPPRPAANDGNPPSAPRGATDFNSLDIFSNTPVPSTSVDICYDDGFKLNSGLQSVDGSGVMLVGGEAFSWRPWGKKTSLVNSKGQWEVDTSAFDLLSLVWPRPDLLILGLGPELRPLSPSTKKYITSLGMRVEILDTRNAASQFNMLATERGVDDVAAALIPIGWKNK